MALAALMAMGLDCRADPATFNVLPPALPLSCLSVSKDAEALEYPSTVGGAVNAVVRVEMTFPSAQDAPFVKTLSNSGGAAFEEIVARRVASYRLPCLEPGRSITLQQTFDFMGAKPDGARALTFDPRYAVDELADQGCVVDGLDKAAEYPDGLMGVPSSGTVLVKVDFAVAVAAPKVSVLYDGGEPRFAARVLDVVNDYRLRCRQPLAKPVSASQTFSFVREDEHKFSLKKSLTLQQFLGAVEQLDKQKVRFDLTTMDCPFQVQFALYRPFLDNRVNADLLHHPERSEFAQWLRQLVIPFPPKAMRTVIGQPTDISVPCAVIDLT